VGIVGCSGSGKSTLIKLLCRYYDVKQGSILINGQDISTVSQNSLRQHIAVVPQDCSLFNRTIMENIRYGKFKATDEQVIEASKKAYCHGFIMKTPNGYQSKVGERGVMLSGGERQRISIARVILKDAPILILDEATSALDTQSEQYIQRSIKSLMKGKTVIAIAHRLSTLNQMDRIIVVDNGKIIEQGSNKELLRKKGVYYKLYKTQSAGFINESVTKDKS
jgi:ATP-binding cassette subfamily B protein